MARIRSIKPETFTSEDVNGLGLGARWTFVGLWCYVDDEGRGRADPRLIKAVVWPIDDTVTAVEISGWLDEMEKRHMICRYKANNATLMHVVNFDTHQRINRPTDSKLPPCSKDIHGGLTEPSVSPHGALTEGSRQEQGTGNREGEQGTPTAPVASRPAGDSITQRSKRITDAYAQAEPMCKWPAINGIVIKAIKTEKYADEEIRDALLRLADEGRPVTIETLRTELAGHPPPGNALALRSGVSKQSVAGQRLTQAMALSARYEEEDAS